MIDPVLRALGWNLENPEQVIPEYSTEVGRPDYFLFYEEKQNYTKPFIGIEAKKLGVGDSEFKRALKKHFLFIRQKE